MNERNIINSSVKRKAVSNLCRKTVYHTPTDMDVLDDLTLDPRPIDMGSHMMEVITYLLLDNFQDLLNLFPKNKTPNRSFELVSTTK